MHYYHIHFGRQGVSTHYHYRDHKSAFFFAMVNITSLANEVDI